MYTVRHEVWNRHNGLVSKVAVRNTLGQFHGATNFRGGEEKFTSRHAGFVVSDETPDEEDSLLERTLSTPTVFD